MKKRSLLLSLSPVLLACTGILAGCASDRPRQVVVVPSPKYLADAPPPARVEVRTTAPSDAYLWSPGYWTRVDYRWVWIPGSWQPAGVAVGGAVDVD